MPFVDTNSPLTTKSQNFDIKRQNNSESSDRHSILLPSLGLVRSFFCFTVGGFLTREGALRLTGRTPSYYALISIGSNLMACIQPGLLDDFWKL